MKEVVDQINAHIWAVLHHRWLALFSAIVICIAGWTVVHHMPDKYMAETKVFLDTQTVLKSLLEGIAVDSNVREHAAQVMHRTLVTRPNLEKVVRDTDLNLRVKTPKDMEAQVSALERNISVSSVSLVDRSSSNLYRISYVNRDPQLAKKVVDVLLNIFVENILGASRKDTFKAQEFLDEQIKEYEEKQRLAEQRLKDFKQKHSGVMPQDGQGYYARINALDVRIEETKLRLRETENRISAMRQQINDFVASASTNNTRDLNLPPDPLDVRIENMEQKLDELQLHYTQQHPDVISTKNALEQLRQQKLEEEQNRPQEEQQIDENVQSSDLYQELNVMLGELESEAAALRIRLNEYNRKKEEMSEQLDKLPEIEAKLVNLNRDYNITKQIYENLVMRRESSQLSYEAEQTGDELQFRIIEPPRVPLIPFSPDRIILFTMVLIGGVGAGIGITLLFELVRPTFFTRQQLEENYDLPVLGSVSMYWSFAERAKRRMGVVMFVSVSALLLCIYAGLMVQFGLGIDLTSKIAALKSGLIT